MEPGPRGPPPRRATARRDPQVPRRHPPRPAARGPPRRRRLAQPPRRRDAERAGHPRLGGTVQAEPVRGRTAACVGRAGLGLPAGLAPGCARGPVLRPASRARGRPARPRRPPAGGPRAARSRGRPRPPRRGVCAELLRPGADRGDRGDGRPLGRRADRAHPRAVRGQGPAVHPHQRLGRRRARGTGDPRGGHAVPLSRRARPALSNVKWGEWALSNVR
ncbi:hypothetical protein MICRO80W_20022 [Micrococcus luteus]|nr:hypothetical protein MICRO80W_20022 [Micrococcus luteus]